MIEHIKKFDIIHGETPIEKLNWLSQKLNTNIYIKRDDCTGLAFGGNKARKLEYLVADAIEHGADTLVTCGGIQSNHARQTAAAAAKFGLDCTLILEPVSGTPEQHYIDSGNVLLNHILGADIQYTNGVELDVFTDELIARLKREGKKPYFIPIGGSDPVGAMGYVNCGIEISRQIKKAQLDVDLIIHATGSAGTQAGLVTGLQLAECPIPVLGICVSRAGDKQEDIVWQLTNDLLAQYKLPCNIERDQIKANGDFYGQGYGILNPETIEAIKMLAQHEGILLDPVYSGKAMAGLISLVENGQIRDKNILFIHTGGAPGLFAYQSYFE